MSSSDKWRARSDRAIVAALLAGLDRARDGVTEYVLERAARILHTRAVTATAHNLDDVRDTPGPGDEDTAGRPGSHFYPPCGSEHVEPCRFGPSRIFERVERCERCGTRRGW